MLNFRVATALFGALILLSACAKPEKQEAGESGADFKVDEGSVSGIADAILPIDAWQKPMSATFQFVACLSDRARDTKFNGQRFDIEDTLNNKGLASEVTNPKGCIVWNEPILFNYFANRSRWVVLERDIVGTGVHRGRRHMTFAVNPWLAAGRKEIGPSQAGYYLRDEPLALKDPQARLKRLYELLKQALSGEHKASQTDEDFLRGLASDQSLLVRGPDGTAALNGDTGSAAIWVDEIKMLNLKTRNISIDEGLMEAARKEGKPEPERGYLVEQTILIKPRLGFKKANGETAFEDIAKGDFDVYVQVVATNTGFDQNKRLILSQSLNPVSQAVKEGRKDFDPDAKPDGVGKVVDGQLIAYVNFKVTRHVAEGNVDLVIRLVPKRIGNRRPKVFEGIFNMGRVNSWVGGAASAVIAKKCVAGMSDPSDDCSYEGYLNKTNNYLEMKRQHEAKAAEPYQYTTLKARFVQVDTGEISVDGSGGLKVQSGETATRRTVLYSGSTCVTDSSGDRLAGQKFIVRYLDLDGSQGNAKPMERTTDDSGCLQWTNTITHSYYKPEKFFRQVILFEGAGGARRTRTIYINPWDDKFTFSFDEEELGRDFFERIEKRPRIQSRFFLGNYQYHTVRFLYEIDPYMDLEVKKTVLMDLAPKVLRYSGIMSGRKVTEDLRDGIYLLRVGIQKSYLDPSDRFHKLCDADHARLGRDSEGGLQEQWERAAVVDSNLCSLSPAQRRVSLDDQAQKLTMQNLEDTVEPKDFVTTKTTLVRVTDGQIIQPVELSMKDLRLMRIRSNFLLQLETVDERKVLLNDSLNQAYRKLVAQVLAEQRKKVEEFRARSGNLEDAETVKVREAASQLALKAATNKREYFRELYRKELHRLNVDGNIISDFNRRPEDLAAMLERFELVQDPGRDLQNEDVRPFERYQIYQKLKQNDFTKIGLPDCERTNCDEFIEADSGLERRTFVGPVIFLSNGYSDAVRATDNLDEARCNDRIEGVDYQPATMEPLERSLLKLESSLLTQQEETLEVQRSNSAYRYNKYFSSLRPFCLRDVPGTGKKEVYAKQVTDLIHEEKSLKQEYANKIKALATPYNFITLFNLDFFSFGGEKLKRLDEAKRTAGCEEKGLDACMSETSERTLQPLQLTELANRDLEQRSLIARAAFARWKFWRPLTKKQAFSLRDLEVAVFGKDYEGDSAVAACGLLASLVGENYAHLYPDASRYEKADAEGLAFNNCIKYGSTGFYRDRKLRIYNTGDYSFMGGMQLNFNVTYSFGVSRSSSTSASLDYLSFGKQLLGIAGPVGAAVLAITRQVDLKQSQSLGESRGTSVSEQTYLVGQIAKFSIPLKEWENCVVLRLRPEVVQAIAQDMHDWSAREDAPVEAGGVPLLGVKIIRNALLSRMLGNGQDPATNDRINAVFTRGIFVCDGVHSKTEELKDGTVKIGKDIEELYFYFTQHFTEGDMLDQADLYNHPWLLSLRGLRDFSAFVQLIRAQEVAGLRNFVDTLVGKNPKSDGPAWALDHMANVYKSILPSFPGLYTVLEEREGVDFFPLKSKKFSLRDLDINREVERKAVLRSGAQVK